MQVARPHSHLSNRAKVRVGLDRRPVFKSVLENPFQLCWPSVPVNLQNAVLARLVVALENVPLRTRAPRKPHSSRQGVTEEVQASAQPNLQALDHEVLSVSSHFVVGINAVTRVLEAQLRSTRKRVIIDHHPQNHDQLPPPHTPSPIVVVFVCCADVDPSALIAHIPHLVAGCNSSRDVGHPIRLVPLPKGSESTISQLLGVRRAAVLAFRKGSPLSETVRDILDTVPIIRAPWLCPSDNQGPQLVPTHIKQLHTTAPKDMRSAREQRSKARAEAKKSVSASSQAVHRKPRITLTTENAM